MLNSEWDEKKGNVGGRNTRCMDFLILINVRHSISNQDLIDLDLVVLG